MTIKGKKREMYLSFRMSEEKIEKLDRIAKARGAAVFSDEHAVDRSMICRQAIDEYLARSVDL